jgi:hypothetical protein
MSEKASVTGGHIPKLKLDELLEELDELLTISQLTGHLR